MTGDERKPSKTRRKQAVHALQALGEELVELKEEQLAAIEMPERLRDAVTAARGISKHEARRRQLQYIGKIMRNVDPAPIRAALDVWRSQASRYTAAHRLAEAWRERLLNDDASLSAFLQEYPRADARHLLALMGAASRERESNRPPRGYRELFQALRALIEEKRDS